MDNKYIKKNFIRFLKARNLKYSTIHTYLYEVSVLFNYITFQDVPYVTADDMMEIIEKRRETYDEKKLKRWISVVGIFFDFCIHEGIRDDDPLYFLDNHLKKPAKSAEYARALLDLPMDETFYGLRDAAIIAIACYTPIKYSHFPRLTLGSFYAGKSQLVFDDNIIYLLSDHVAKKVERLVVYMRKYLKMNKYAPLFSSTKGKPLSRSAINKIIMIAELRTGEINEKCNPIHLQGCLAPIVMAD